MGQEWKQDLKGKSVEAVGMVERTNEEGDREYVNVIFTILDGKVTSMRELAVSYATTQAINDAVGWIDQKYWEE